MSGIFGEVRHAGPGLEEAARAKASWGPSEARGPMRGSRSQSQEVQLIVSLIRDLAKQMICSLIVLFRMLVRDVTVLLFKAASLDSRRNLGQAMLAMLVQHSLFIVSRPSPLLPHGLVLIY